MTRARVASLRTAAALFVVAALALPALPARASQTASATLSSPQNGAVISGGVSVLGSGHAVAGIKRLEVIIDSQSVTNFQPSGYRQDSPIRYDWDTYRSVSSPDVAANGPHTITVHVVATDGSEDQSTGRFEVNNPPVAPAGLSAKESGGIITVSWAPNPEPDILNYVVERDSGAGFVVVGRTTSTSVTDHLVAGTYSYRVSAVRSSPASSRGISSSASSPVSVRVASSAGGSRSVTELRGRHAANGSAPLGGRGNSRSSIGSLLSSVRLGSAKLPPIPAPAGIPWGSYKKKLPYGPAAARPPRLRTMLTRSLGPSPSLVPPDGLKWLAAGFLMLVCALLVRFLAVRPVPWPAGSVTEVRAWVAERLPSRERVRELRTKLRI